MKQFITGNTVANTVRMGARSRRPKAVFLASDEADVALARTIFSEGKCRIIPAHTRENAIQALNLLVKSGYEGVVTAVNTHFAPAIERDIVGDVAATSTDLIGIEGTWEEVRTEETLLAGQHVRVTIIDPSAEEGNGSESAGANRPPNAAMLRALSEVEVVRKEMNPKKDEKDYLREARSGAMYGFGDDN